MSVERWSLLKTYAPGVFEALKAVKQRGRGALERVQVSRFQKRYPKTLILTGPQGAESYSQHGQDALASQIFDALGTETGFYVDVGCNDPFRFNNTWLFERRGWRGLAIDPQPFGDLWGARKTPFIQAALGGGDEELVLCVPVDGAIGTDHDHMFAALEQSTTSKLRGVPTRRIVVPQRRLDDVVEAAGAHHIDFLSLDVEGFESSVLEGLDLSRVSVDVICVENDRPAWGAHPIREKLQSMGFVFWARARPYDDIFVSSKVAQRLQRLHPAEERKSIAR